MAHISKLWNVEHPEILAEYLGLDCTTLGERLPLILWKNGAKGVVRTVNDGGEMLSEVVRGYNEGIMKTFLVAVCFAGAALLCSLSVGYSDVKGKRRQVKDGKRQTCKSEEGCGLRLDNV